MFEVEFSNCRTSFHTLKGSDTSIELGRHINGSRRRRCMPRIFPDDVDGDPRLDRLRPEGVS